MFLEATPEDNLIDNDFLGLAIGDTIDCKLNELLPIIKELYKKGYVSIGVNGSYKEVEKYFSKLSTDHSKRELYNIFELYDNVLDTWAGYREENEISDFYKPQQAVSNKINRNDPCPCGSGKKYKKCCLGN